MVKALSDSGARVVIPVVTRHRCGWCDERVNHAEFCGTSHNKLQGRDAQQTVSQGASVMILNCSVDSLSGDHIGCGPTLQGDTVLKSLVAFLLFFISCAPAFAQDPPTNGLRFWLDATSVSGKGRHQKFPGDRVKSWKDKVGGIELSQSETNRIPFFNNLGESFGIYFDGKSSLLATNLTEISFRDDQQGTIVKIFDCNPAYARTLYGLQVAASTSTAYMATYITGQHWNQGEFVSGLGIQANNGPVINTALSGNKSVIDGDLHISMISSDSTQWYFYTDGEGPLSTKIWMSPNDGKWYGDVPELDLISVGQFTVGSHRLQRNTPGHIGHIGEILIYDHPLTRAERDEFWKYVYRKYYKPRDAAGVPTGLTSRSGFVFVDWDDSEAEVLGYHVYRSSTSDGQLERITKIPIDESHFEDLDVHPDKTYVYAVTSVNDKGESELSEPFTLESTFRKSP
jgi:hypothetical protein